MKSKKEIQEIVNEISALCKKHGVLLIGTCDDEEAYSEITIIDKSGNNRFICEHEDYADNVVYERLNHIIYELLDDDFCVNGIG